MSCCMSLLPLFDSNLRVLRRLFHSGMMTAIVRSSSAIRTGTSGYSSAVLRTTPEGRGDFKQCAAAAAPSAGCMTPATLRSQQSPLTVVAAAHARCAAIENLVEGTGETVDWRQLPLPLHERPAQHHCQLTDLRAWHQQAKQAAGNTRDSFVADNGPSSSELQASRDPVDLLMLHGRQTGRG
jgi:hypothetical protein